MDNLETFATVGHKT